MAITALTRRGRIVAGVCVVGTVMALVVGGRSLNAVVIPSAVALGAAYLQVSRIDPPGVRRSGFADGFVGETHEIRIQFHGDRPGTPVETEFIADVSDRLDGGLVGPNDPIRTTVGGGSATYRVRYRNRGGQRFGPVDVVATDVLGLFEKRLVVDVQDRVVVYPECHPVPAWFRRGLYADTALGESRQREEFDRLREYARGDSLRDVHWTATAKHDDLIVKEFAAETEHRRVSIAGETDGTRAAAAAVVLASASASLALALLDEGIPVELSLPAGEVDVRPGPRGRRDVLELAARTGTGTVADPDEADVRIEAGTVDARIRADGVDVGFSDLKRAATTGEASPRTADAPPGDRTDSTGTGPAGAVTASDGGVVR